MGTYEKQLELLSSINKSNYSLLEGTLIDRLRQIFPDAKEDDVKIYCLSVNIQPKIIVSSDQTDGIEVIVLDILFDGETYILRGREYYSHEILHSGVDFNVEIGFDNLHSVAECFE